MKQNENVMKTSKLITVAMLVAGVVTTTWADVPSRFAVVKRGEGVFKLIYTGAAAQTIVTVKNRFGEIVFTERINSSKGFILPLNFTRLQPGSYLVEVTSGNEKYTEVIHYGVPRENQMAATVVAHVTRLADSRYLCSVKTNGAEPVTLYIQNEAGETLQQHQIQEAEAALVVSLKQFNGRPVFVLQDASGNAVTIRK
jgi:hypothetical protein